MCLIPTPTTQKKYSPEIISSLPYWTETRSESNTTTLPNPSDFYEWMLQNPTKQDTEKWSADDRKQKNILPIRSKTKPFHWFSILHNDQWIVMTEFWVMYIWTEN
jgi:hypothetical protein